MNREIYSILPVIPRPVSPGQSRPPASKGKKPSFENTLQKELGKGQDLKFSAHAEKRLKERNIVMAQEDLARIVGAVREAEAKGAHESLIIYGDLALIASVRNKTVVTAMESRSSEAHVFTNIDSAVIVNKQDVNK